MSGENETSARVKKARKNLDGLRARKAESEAKIAEFSEAKAANAAALLRGDVKARANAPDLRGKLETEEELVAAIVTETVNAEAELRAAQESEAAYGAKQRIEAGMAAATSAAERAERVKSHIAAAVAELGAYFADIEAVRRAGADFTGRELMRIKIEEAWKLEALPLRARPYSFAVDVNSSHRIRTEIESTLRYYAEAAMRALKTLHAKAEQTISERVRKAA